MAKRFEIKCMVCSKEESFDDEKDIVYSKWRIVAWNVVDGIPKCTCDKCEYELPYSKES